jgi:hypothetical protein
MTKIETSEKSAKISKGITKRLNGIIIEERYLTVTGDKLKEVSKEFDERWEDDN